MAPAFLPDVGLWATVFSPTLTLAAVLYVYGGAREFSVYFPAFILTLAVFHSLSHGRRAREKRAWIEAFRAHPPADRTEPPLEPPRRDVSFHWAAGIGAP